MEALDMGLEDYLATDTWIFMEWPDKIPSLMPEDSVAVSIEILSPTEMQLSF
jgi:tRNA threonylcarbamoyladenosine biosynthesis protein TsaE